MTHRLKILLLLLITFSNSFGQGLSELDKRSGFKDIRLASPIDSVVGYKLVKEFKERDQFPAKLFEVENTDYEKVGEVKVHKIELADGSLQYRIESVKSDVRKKNLYFNSDGRLIKDRITI